jgi:hypothetical protein
MLCLEVIVNGGLRTIATRWQNRYRPKLLHTRSLPEDEDDFEQYQLSFWQKRHEV